jgi:hypothetical protein
VFDREKKGVCDVREVGPFHISYRSAYKLRSKEITSVNAGWNNYKVFKYLPYREAASKVDSRNRGRGAHWLYRV